MRSTKKKVAGQPPAPQSSALAPQGTIEVLGSKSEAFQIMVLTQALESMWQPGGKSDANKEQELQAIFEALQSIAPRSELEGMLAVQMIAVHNAAMECMRRAMIDGQSFEGRDQNLKHAAKLMGVYERQLCALDKHRGKGQQKITVEHVTVEAGGQAIVGDVSLAAEAKDAELEPPPGSAQVTPQVRQAKVSDPRHGKSGR